MDIQKQKIWISHPRDFNDPYDCQIGYDAASYEKHLVIQYIKQAGCVDLERKAFGFTSDEFKRILGTITYFNWNWYKNLEDFDQVLRELLASKDEKFVREINNMIWNSQNEANLVIERLRMGNIRVACFSALDRRKGFNDVIQMWSHYAHNHTGFCVEYDISPLKETGRINLECWSFYSDESKYMDERITPILKAGLFPVIYSANRVNVPKTKLYKIISKNKTQKSNGEIDALLYKAYIMKSAKWNYEKEWRIILDGDLCSYYDNKLPFPYVKTIYLGCKMRTETIDTMILIAKDIGAEIVMMKMSDEKFILEEHSLDRYEWDKKWNSRKNPY
jgi:hypothetical protein